VKAPTGSALPLIRICPAAWAIPHAHSVSTFSKMGDALHVHMHDRAAFGVGEAMLRVDEVARAHEMTDREAGIFAARCRGFEWCPPAHAFGEVSLAMLEDGSVIRVRGGKGDYETPPGTLVALTLDVMWSEPAPLDLTDPAHPRCPSGSMLWVVDYKSGEDRWVEPVEHNAQVGAEALLAARWTGAAAVVPSILFIRKGPGEWDAPPSAWGPRELADQERRLREWVAGSREQQRRAAAGEPLDMIEGPHCGTCPARARCSAHTTMLHMVATDGAKLIPQGDAPLDDAEAHWLATRLRSIDGFARQARQALIAHVRAKGPIDLRDGNLWGPFPRRRTTVVVKAAVQTLVEELGEEGANEAIVVAESVTRESIEEVVRAQHAEKGIKRQLAPTVRRIFAKLGEAGALVSEDEVQFGAHKPAPPPEDLEAALEASLDELAG